MDASLRLPHDVKFIQPLDFESNRVALRHRVAMFRTRIMAFPN